MTILGCRCRSIVGCLGLFIICVLVCVFVRERVHARVFLHTYAFLFFPGRLRVCLSANQPSCVCKWAWLWIDDCE